MFEPRAAMHGLEVATMSSPHEETYATIGFAMSDHVARITLNRPDAGNALNAALLHDLSAVTERCMEDPAVRVVVIDGAGKSFCVGGDLRSFTSEGDALSEHLEEILTDFHTAVARLARMNAPVIASVHGVAAGGGLSLACACDLVIAAESTRFTMAYTRVGLSPDGSGSYFLPRLVGLRRALDLTLTNRMLSAREALDWGLVSRVVPDDALAAETATLAAQLAAGAPDALAAAKKLLRESGNASLEEQLVREIRAIALRAADPESREGMTAFLEKRAPRFEGL